MSAAEGGPPAPARFGSLEEVRAAIDDLDRRLVRLLAARAGCVAAAAAFKTSEQGVRAPDRLARMLADRRAWADAEGLDPDFVEGLFRAVTSHFIARELEAWEGSRERGA